MLEALREKFGRQFAEKATNTLSYVEELLFERGEILRPEIEQYVKSCLEGVGPTDQHRYLFSIPWRAVLTTNYDNIPDLLIRTIDGNRYIIPVIDLPLNDKTVDPRNNELLYCFKLMGDYNSTHPHKGWMVLSQSDKTKSVNRRNYFFNIFSSLASTGLIIYVGYSFDDRLILQMLSDMKYELHHFPWKGYAISPTQPNPKMLARMKEYNIEWIKGTLSELVGNLRMVFGAKPNSFFIPSTPLLVNNIVINLDKSVKLSIRHKFRYLNNKMMEPISTDPRSFFSGKESSFYPYKAKFDYPRPLKLESKKSLRVENQRCNYISTKDLVIERQKARSSNQNLFMILTGIAGSGKTVIANRIAYDWYQNKDPVIFIDSRNPFADVQILEELIDEITAKYRQLSTEIEPRNPKFLLVADDRPNIFKELIDTFRRCKGDGKPVDVLLVARDSELPLRDRRNPFVGRILSIEDKISTMEIGKFADHLVSIKFVNNKDQVIPYIDDPQINSFFEMMWRAINESKVRIETALCNEYDKLSPKAKKIYGFVSLIQAFNLEPILSLIEKMSKEDLMWLNSELADGYLSGVLQYNSQTHKVVCNHRIVAGIVAKHAFPKKEDALTAIKALVASVTDGNVAEMEIMDDLLNHRLENQMGIARDFQFTNQQKLELFDSALKRVKTGPLLHHKAMVERSMKKFSKARESIKEAKTIHYPGFDEPESYLLDTEARIELDEARISKDEKEKWDHLERAYSIFEQAKDTPLTTPHVYHGLAYTYLEEAKISDRSAKSAYLLLALQQVDHFRDRVGSYEHKGVSVYPIEKKVLSELNKMGFGEADAEIIADTFHNGSGFAFLAEQRMSKNKFNEDTLRLIDKGLYYVANSVWLLKLKFEYLKKVEGIEKRGLIIPILQAYENVHKKEYDPVLDFELAKQKFIDGNYTESFGIFRSLSNSSHMNPSRYEMIEENRWLLGDKPMECIGEIIQIPIGKNGLIKMTYPKGCTELIQVRQRYFPTNIRPGDKVRFEIIFNYAGPQASRIVKLG